MPHQISPKQLFKRVFESLRRIFKLRRTAIGVAFLYALKLNSLRRIILRKIKEGPDPTQNSHDFGGMKLPSRGYFSVKVC